MAKEVKCECRKCGKIKEGHHQPVEFPHKATQLHPRSPGQTDIHVDFTSDEPRPHGWRTKTPEKEQEYKYIE